MVGFAFDERSERAQLILVGAVAIAFIVLGLAVVFNTVLYTENVASTGAASAPRDAQLVKQEVEFGVKELIARTNMEGRWEGSTLANGRENARDGTSRNVSQYRDGMIRVQGQSGTVLMSFEALDTTDAGGSDVMGAAVHHENGQFENTAGEENWSVVSSGAAPLGDFRMSVDANTLAPEDSDDMFRVVWNASESQNNYTVWIYKNDGPDGNVAIRTFNGSGSIDPVNEFGTESDECVLDDANGPSTRVEFRFSEGEIVGHPECSGQIDVSGGIPSEATRTLSFHRGGSVTGDYELVVNDPASLNFNIASPSTLSPPFLSSDSPYWTHAVWKITLAVTYESGQASFEDSYPIEVYNRSR